MLRVRQLRQAPWLSYVVFDETSRQAAVVDPTPEVCDLIELLVDDEELQPVALVQTQSHGERPCGVAALRQEYDVPLLSPTPRPQAQAGLVDGGHIRLGERELRVGSAPGVSPDAVILVGDGFVLSGHTLHAGGSGELGLPGSCAHALFDSLSRVFDSLADETLVYSGEERQGALFSTLGHERAHNPALRERDRERFVADKLQEPDPSGPKAEAGQCPQTDVHDAHRRTRGGATLFDIREAFELLTGELPDAQHLPLSSLGEGLSQLPQAEPALLICGHGVRSVQAARTLGRLGYEVISVVGGVGAWRQAGLRIL